MKKLITALIGIIGLIAVLVIALVVYIITLDPNDYKDVIAEQVQKDTGRQITLGGDIRLSYYPWLGLEINDVTLANATGFGEQPFVHVDYLQVRVKTMPLLQDQYEIDTVKLHGAVINLVKNQAGTTNWQDLTSAEKERKPLPLSSLILGGVDIKDARLTWQDDSTGLRHEIHDLDLTTGELVYGEPIDLNMMLSASSNQPAIRGEATMTGTIAYDMDNESVAINPLTLKASLAGDNVPGGREELSLSAEIGLNFADETASISRMALEVLGMRVAGDVQAKNILSPAPSLETSVDINGRDLALLFKVAEIEPLATQLAGLRNRQFNLRTNMAADLDRGDVSVPELNAELLGASIKGQVKAQKINTDTPSFQGELNASGPDLPTLLQVVGQFEGGQEPRLEAYGSKLAAIPAGQKAFSFDAWVDADMQTGDINIPRLSLQSLGVKVAGNLKATAMQDRNGTIAGRLEASGQNMSRVLAALDQQSLAEVLQDFNLETTVDGSRADLNLKPVALTASFAGRNIPNSPVRLEMNADTRLNLESGELHLDAFTLQGLGLNVSGNLAAQDINESARFQGRLNIAEFNLRRLMQQLNIDVPATADQETLKKVALNSEFSGSRTDMRVKELVATLDDTTLKGNLAVTDFQNPASEFNLDIDSFNADRYLPPKQEGKQQTKQEQQATPLPVETLRSLNTSGKLHIGQFVISNMRLQDVNMTLNGKDGIVKLEPVTAGLYQGSYAGDITLNAADREKQPRLTINTALKNVQVEPLLSDVTGKRKVRGTGDFSAALFAVGEDTDMIKQTLNGQMNFSFRDGALIGFNLGKIMRMGNQLQETMTLKVSDQEETDFTEITGNPVATNGVITMDDLNAKSPALRLSGQGVLADLTNNSLDYMVTARIVATSKGQGGREVTEGKLEGVPLDCRFRGSLDNPKRDCDATKLIAALGLKVIKGIVNLPGKVISGGEQDGGTGSALGNLLNKLPIPGQGDATQTEQQTTEPQQESESEGTVKKAEELLKGIFGR